MGGAGTFRRTANEYRLRIRRDARSYLAGLRSPKGRIRVFAVVANARTGSTLLCDLLDAHPRIRCEDEVLKTFRDYPLLFLRGSARRAASQGFDAYGVKLNSNTTLLTPSREDVFKLFIDALAADGFMFIRLRRRNIVRQGISVVRAAESVYHDRGAGGQPKSIHVDIDRFFGVMATLEIHDRHIGRILEPHQTHEFWYEDDLFDEAAQQTTVDKVSGLADLRPEGVSSSLRKLTPLRLHDALANYEEIASHLRGTKYERFLDD